MSAATVPPTPVTISTVTPVYRGCDLLPGLVERLDVVRQGFVDSGAPIELVEAVFVDDGSTDGSAEVLEKLSAIHPWITVVSLSRNFGQHPATVAGILHTGGEWVVTLDEDLQHEPEHIEELLRIAIQGRHDLVYARPAGDSHSWWRDIASRVFKRSLVWLADNPALRLMSSFRLIRGDLARGAAASIDHETYLDVGLSWFVDRLGDVEIEMVDERYATTGDSGYGLRSLVRHARRAVFSSKTKVTRLAAGLGLLAVLTAVVFAIRALLGVSSSGPESVPGWPSLFMAILFFGGVLCVLGVVALEYATTTALHLKGKPTFFAVDRRRDAILRDYFARR